MKIKIAYLAALSALVISSCTSGAPKNTTPAQSEDENAVVAKLNGQPILNKELNEKIKGQLSEIEDQYQEQKYQLKHRALEQMIVQRLIEPKAKAAGKDIEGYIKSEFTDKVAMPSDAEIQTTYDQAVKAGQKLPPLPQIKDNIASFLRQQKVQPILQAFLEKLKTEANVEILLPAYKRPLPPRNEKVEAKGFSRGAENAPVTIIEFSDYECPFCGQAEKTVNKVMDTYAGKVRLFYRDFPLPMHSHAQKASEAAHCAADQNKYWEMHAKLFENQRALEVASLKEYAKALNLDTKKFDNCLDSGEKAQAVAEGHKAGEELSVNSTPAFFINGILVSGAQPFEAFKEVIDSELARTQPQK